MVDSAINNVFKDFDSCSLLHHPQDLLLHSKAFYPYWWWRTVSPRVTSSSHTSFMSERTGKLLPCGSIKDKKKQQKPSYFLFPTISYSLFESHWPHVGFSLPTLNHSLVKGEFSGEIWLIICREADLSNTFLKSLYFTVQLLLFEWMNEREQAYLWPQQVEILVTSRKPTVHWHRNKPYLSNLRVDNAARHWLCIRGGKSIPLTHTFALGQFCCDTD